MAHINLINMIESYTIPWSRYRAQAYYSPMGCKIPWLTKGEHVCTCVCVSSCRITCVLCPRAGGDGVVITMHKAEYGKTIMGNHPAPVAGELFPGFLCWGPCEGWLSHFRVTSIFPRLCLHHQHNLGCFRLHVGALQTNLWCLWLPARILEVASKVGSSYPWFQLPPIGPSVRICCHAGRTSRKMLLCLCVLDVVGSYLLCLYPVSSEGVL